RAGAVPAPPSGQDGAEGRATGFGAILRLDPVAATGCKSPAMSRCCGDDLCSSQRPAEGRWRLALWLALAINAGMFAVEGVAGLLSGSASLQADALDFLGDAANYAISLGVV